MEEPDSANSSFYSTRSAPASQGGPRAASSTQSLARLGSPDDANSALLSLPGYRPTTRSSARRSQAGVSSGAPPGRDRLLDKPKAGGRVPSSMSPAPPPRTCPSGLCWAVRLTSGWMPEMLTRGAWDAQLLSGVLQAPPPMPRAGTCLPGAPGHHWFLAFHFVSPGGTASACNPREEAARQCPWQCL